MCNGERHRRKGGRQRESECERKSTKGAAELWQEKLEIRWTENFREFRRIIQSGSDTCVENVRYPTKPRMLLIGETND